MKPESATAAELNALLASDADIQLKARSCQQLAINGTADSVPALEKLLGDEKLGDYARCALENIPSPAAAEALRRALPALKGRLLAGAVNSLGVLRDTAAVPALAALAQSPASERESGALAALAQIASDEAVGGIRSALSGPNARAAAQAALAAASQLLDDSKKAAALALLRDLTTSKPPPHLLDAAGALEWNANAVSLFDGRTLDGWEGDNAWFRIFDSAVIAGSRTRPIPQNEFLVSAREFGDFELRLQVRLIGGKGNGGIQFRSQRVAGSREMIGYQADVGPDYWGGLYDESRRNTFLGTRCKPEALAAVLRPDGWNDYRIRCEGKNIQLHINGLLTTEFVETDPQIAASGRIGLQIHSGDPVEVCYRNLRIRELKA